MDLVQEFKSARRVSTPLLQVLTANQPETIRTLIGAVPKETAVLVWDHVRGLKAVGKPGQQVLAGLNGGQGSSDPADMLGMVVDETPTNLLLLMVNAHRFVDDPRVSTGIGNLREAFKSNGRTLVMLGPAFTLPLELVSDVVILRDSLPDDRALKAKATVILSEVKMEVEPAQMQSIVNAGRGLSSFGFEQQFYMSLPAARKDGVNLDSLWSRKMEAVNAVPGLKMQMPRLPPGSIVGLDALIQDHLGLVERPGAIAFIDELDKKMGGVGYSGAGDNTGVAQDQLGTMLEWMEDNELSGAMLSGPPGTGKTFAAKVIASMLGIPFVQIDLGGMKASLVGESEARVRLALETVLRVGAGQTLVLVTSNRNEAIPPEFVRRLTEGKWFVDIHKDTTKLFDLYTKKYEVPMPKDQARFEWWTGAEVRNVCRRASRRRKPVEDVAGAIIPIYQSGAADVERVRKQAEGKFVDAQTGEPYVRPSLEAEVGGSGRKVDRDNDW